MVESNPADRHFLSNPETWVDQHGDYLFGYAMLRLRDKRAAEDAVQETFLAALKARERFGGQSSERTWLVGILKNKIIDDFRKTGREKGFEDIEAFCAQPDEDFEATGQSIGQWRINRRPADWMVDTTDPSELREFWEFLRLCLSELPKRIADIFAMRELEGLESEEICNELQISPTNLRVTLHRARKQLRRCLEKNWIGKKSTGKSR